MSIKDEVLECALAAVQSDELLGFCVKCGEEYPEQLEPDARKILCPFCGSNSVYGAEEIVLIYG